MRLILTRANFEEGCIIRLEITKVDHHKIDVAAKEGNPGLVNMYVDLLDMDERGAGVKP